MVQTKYFPSLHTVLTHLMPDVSLRMPRLLKLQGFHQRLKLQKLEEAGSPDCIYFWYKRSRMFGLYSGYVSITPLMARF